MSNYQPVSPIEGCECGCRAADPQVLIDAMSAGDCIACGASIGLTPVASGLCPLCVLGARKA